LRLRFWRPSERPGEHGVILVRHKSRLEMDFSSPEEAAENFEAIDFLLKVNRDAPSGSLPAIAAEYKPRKRRAGGVA
jgi:hypothetical protein